jgi:hypothetical protein
VAATPVAEHLDVLAQVVLRVGSRGVGCILCTRAFFRLSKKLSMGVWWKSTPGAGLRRHQTIVSASVTLSAIMRGLTDQSTILR